MSAQANTEVFHQELDDMRRRDREVSDVELLSQKIADMRISGQKPGHLSVAQRKRAIPKLHARLRWDILAGNNKGVIAEEVYIYWVDLALWRRAKVILSWIQDDCNPMLWFRFELPPSETPAADEQFDLSDPLHYNRIRCVLRSAA